jgi:hypothetical protein
VTNASQGQATFATSRHLEVFQFSLVVSDGLATSLPDTVSIAADHYGQSVLLSDVANANSDTETPGKLATLSVGGNVLLVTCRQLGSPLGLVGAIVDSSGRTIQSFPIAAHDCAFPRPSVATSGTGLLVVFQRGGAIVATRLLGPPTYGIVGETVISTGTSNWAPAVAFDGNGYFVVWNKFSDYPNGHDIFGAKVATDGQASAEIPVFVRTGEQIMPSIAFDGVNYLVIWRDTRTGSGPSPDTDIFGTRVAPNGTVLDTAGIAISTAPNVQDEPQLTFDGTNYFAVWTDTRRYPPVTQPPVDVFGTRISPAGALLDGAADTGGIAVFTAVVVPGVVTNPAVTFDGTDYFVTFAVLGFVSPAGIYDARVSTSGALRDGPADRIGRSLSGPPGTSARLVYPAVAYSGGRWVIAWVNNIEGGSAKTIVGVSIDQF